MWLQTLVHKNRTTEVSLVTSSDGNCRGKKQSEMEIHNKERGERNSLSLSPLHEASAGTSVLSAAET